MQLLIFISVVELYKWHSEGIIHYYLLHKLYCLIFVLKKGQLEERLDKTIDG